MKICNRGFIGIVFIIAIIIALGTIGGVSYYSVQQKVKEKQKEDVNYQISIKGTWIHAQEEDTEGNLVYRNSGTYTPLPARFRHYFFLKENNICSSLQLAPNDAHYLKDVNCNLITSGGVTFLNLDNKKYRIVNQSDSKLVLQKVETNITTDLEIYQNDTYGFGFKYPSLWTLRDGSKDYKPAGLDNFYQFCNKAITSTDELSGLNNNFIGSCEGEFFRVNIWKLNTGMKIITKDFSTLKLDRENKITISDKPASEFIYSGLSQALGGVHTWHLFVVQTNYYIYSITGDSCMDNNTECNQIVSTFKFTKLINDEEQQSCSSDSDCVCGVNIKTRSCFLGNKKYIDTTKQCPDFCGGIAGNLITKCINNLCKQVSIPVTE